MSFPDDSNEFIRRASQQLVMSIDTENLSPAMKAYVALLKSEDITLKDFLESIDLIANGCQQLMAELSNLAAESEADNEVYEMMHASERAMSQIRDGVEYISILCGFKQ